MNFLILIVDAALIYGTFLLSYLIRYRGDIPEIRIEPFEDTYLILIGILIAAMTYSGAFRRRYRSYWLLFQKVTYGLTLGTAFCFIFIYLMMGRQELLRVPSSILLINYFLSSVILFVSNALILRIKGKIIKRVVLFGSDEFYDAFAKSKSMTRVKRITDIEQLMNMRDIDEVMISENLQDIPNLNLLIFLLLKLKVSVTFHPSVYAELVAGRIQQDAINLISTFIGRKSDGEEFFIRVLDVVGSLVLFLVFSPFMLVVSFLIKLTSQGPVIYKQQRVGKDRQLFTLYKFRTMTQDSEMLHGHKPAVDDDERITRVGKILRKTRLDELPQLVNILKGQMSLVGPRPENISRVNTHKALRGIRLAVKPGLTGLAQTQSYYDLHPKHKIKYDFLYIQRRSFALNLYILAKTIPVVLGRRGQ
ncbi:MAG: sugar transferase [Planctomycetota bacterium]|jgi:lipopolysaccharide/colanic/teichoic acid biosynthesis glycosyltransferase